LRRLSSPDDLAVGKLGRRIRHSVESSQNRLGELTQILQETVGGNRIVKRSAWKTSRLEISSASRRLLRETMRWVRAQVATSPLMDLLQPIIISCCCFTPRQNQART